MIKRWIPFGVSILMMASVAGASSIHTWASGDVVNAADLNANFNHLHNTMVGGHGPRLVNADVSATAAISHSKLAVPAVVPKAWAQTTVCTSNPCTIGSSSGVSGITRGGAGSYIVTLSAARGDASYGVVVTPWGASLADAADSVICYISSFTTTVINLQCKVTGVTAAASIDTGFTIMILDNA